MIQDDIKICALLRQKQLASMHTLVSNSVDKDDTAVEVY